MRRVVISMSTNIQRSEQMAKVLNGLDKKPNLKDVLEGVKPQEKVDKILVVLLDSSGSMAMLMEDMSKMETAWTVLKNELMPNMQGWTYGIVIFENDAYWSILPCQDTTALISRHVPHPAGSTSMGKALQVAWSWVRSNARQARFAMLTDGQPTDMDKGSILQMAKQNSSIPIDTVGIGAGTYDYDPAFLQELSRITGGMFVEAGSVRMLANTILELAPTNRPLLGPVG